MICYSKVVIRNTVAWVTRALFVSQLSFAGCNEAARDVSLRSVDSSVVAAQIIAMNDANKDGTLDKDELAQCKPLLRRIEIYDVDSSASLSLEEIAARLERLYTSGSMLVSLDCMVAYQGRPLSGALVVFHPIAMLEGLTLPAKGTTDESGMVQLTISDDQKLSSAMQPGLYYVEITHPQKRLPNRYNVETELDFEVDPVSRDGLTARFNLN
jgi:hypothetical protein